MENFDSNRKAFEEIKREGYFISERDDGYATRYPFEYWKGSDHISSWEKEIFRQLQAGKVLDLGCGSGKHVEYLATEGYSAYGIDISEEIVKLGKASNRNVDCVDFWRMREDEQYENIIIMDSSLGFLAPPDDLQAFFEKITMILVEGGNLIITGINWPEATNSKYKKYVSKNTTEGFYPGRVKLRNKSKNMTGNWFVGYYYDLNSIIRKAVLQEFFPQWIGFHDEIKFAVKFQKNTNKFILE